ncbi:MAG: efflux RND transporter permease subunit [Bacteriovorax sp.]
MTLSELSIKRPVLAWMLMAGLIIFGLISFKRMGISQMPDVNFPVVNVSLQLENAAPEVMEMNVVDIIEDALMGIEGLKSITSSTSHGVANITCEFNLNRNIDVALQEVQTRILQVDNRLPTLLYPPVISKINPEDQPIMWVMLTAKDEIPLYQQMMYARNTLKDQLSTIEGVGSVVLAGYVDPNLRVWIDQKKLSFYELTSADIWNAIQSEQTEQPAGRIEAPLKEMNVRVLGEASSPKDFSQIRINNRGAEANFRPIPLSKVARIEEGLSDIRAISRYNDRPVVALGIIKQHSSNAVKVAEMIREKVGRMKGNLLPGYGLDVRLDSTKFIHESVSELNRTLLFAAVLTSVVCFFFLGSWSSTINVLLAIPTSIVGAFTVLYFLGFTLNTFTLLGLSLAIGIVVDDAIMMLENIVRHLEMGKDKKQAAIDGSKEITFAAIATTLAIAAIFIPVIFMKGIVGAFFYQYGVTVTVAVFLSLLEALTLTPMRCARFLVSVKESPGKMVKAMDKIMERLSSYYLRSLKRVLQYRVTVIFVSVLIFVSSLIFVSTLRKELIPAQDQSLFLLNIKTKVGTSIGATNDIFKKAEEYLKNQSEVKDYYATIGSYEHSNVVNAGIIYVTLTNSKNRVLTQSQIMDRTRNELQKILPNTEIFGQDLSLTGFSATRGYPVEFVIEGPDFEKLKNYSTLITSKIKETGFIQDINSDYQAGMPEIIVTPDRKKAGERGVSIAAISQEIETLVGGQILSADTEYPKEGHRYYIRVRAEENQIGGPRDLNKILVRNNRGELVPLDEIANVQITSAPQLITRYNRQRAISVFANVAKDKSQQDALDAVEKIGKQYLPTGYTLKITGSGNAFREAFDRLIFALILGIAVAYMILASQFNSFVHPITILMALPFSLSGALFALTLTHQSISLFSMIGLILLMGIVKKNSILLVDFTNQRRALGESPSEALLHACPVRLRPILMTSIATIAGAVPGAINFGAGAETRIPMAISLIGGVAVSTFLTLYVVPCVYSLFVGLERTHASTPASSAKLEEVKA